jgi:DNA-binding beta-propeller fold protein YncE
LLVLAVAGAALVAALVMAGVLPSRGHEAPRRPSVAPTLAPKVDSLQRIDPTTNSVVATIPAAGADGIAAGDGAVFVARSGAQTVSRIDPRSNAIVKQVSAAGAPTSIALGRTPDGPVLWVVSQRNTKLGSGLEQNSFGECSLSQLDPETLLTNYTLNPTGKDNACGPVVTLGGTTWFGGSSVSLALVDPYTGEAIRTIATGGISDPEAHGLALGAGAEWLASPNTEELYRFDRRGRRAIVIGSGSFPSDVAVGEGAVWVTDSLHDTVVEIDPSRNRIKRTIPVGHDPIAVAAGAGAVWVANNQDGTLSRIDPRTGRVTHFEVGPYPQNIAIGEDGVWVTVHPSSG